MKCWQLQQAKASLSTVVKEAIKNGPQEISLHGEPVVIVIAKKEYEQLTKPKLSLVQLMLQSPLVGSKLKIQRNQSFTRDTEL
jgi:prevent-host-death family protein